MNKAGINNIKGKLGLVQPTWCLIYLGSQICECISKIELIPLLMLSRINNRPSPNCCLFCKTNNLAADLNGVIEQKYFLPDIITITAEEKMRSLKKNKGRSRGLFYYSLLLLFTLTPTVLYCVLGIVYSQLLSMN